MANDNDTKSDGTYTLQLQGGRQDVPITDGDGNPGFVQLTATLTLAQSNQPCPNKSVKFEIMFGHYARLDPCDTGNNQKYTATTDHNGQATVKVYCNKPDNFEVEAIYQDGSSSLNPTNQIQFVVSEAYDLDAALQPTKTTMTQVIMATATVTTKTNGAKNGVKGVPVNMALPDSDDPNDDNIAAFCDSQGVPINGNRFRCTVNSDQDGNAIAYFRSPLWASGSLTVEIADRSGTPEVKDLNYVFTYDNDLIAIFENTVVVQGKNKNITKETPNSGSGNANQATAVAPADGKCVLRISGWVKYKTENKTLPGNPKVTLKADGANASFVNHDPDMPQECTVTCTTPNSGPMAGVPGYFTADLVSTIPETGKVHVTIDRDIDANGNSVSPPLPEEQAFVLYEFDDAWVNINNIGTKFDGRNNNDYFIYANGNHQAPLTLSFTLVDNNGAVIADDSRRSGNDVAARVVLLDYATGQPIGDLYNGGTWPTDEDWVFDGTATQYDQGSADQTPRAAVLATRKNTIDNGEATLYFYIRHSDATALDTMQIGVYIIPTGHYLDNTATLQPAGVVRYSALPSDQTLPGLATVKARPKPTLNNDDLVSKCTEITSFGQQNDDGPANLPSNPEYNYNYFRQFNYSNTISNDFMDKYNITSVTFSIKNPDNLAKNCCYSSRIQSLYDTRLYLWPENISGMNNKGIMVNGVDYKLISNIWYGACFHLEQEEDSTFYVTRYISFGATSYKQFIQTDMNLTMTDNFGTSYDICLLAENPPKPYVAAELTQWKPASIGSGQNNSSDTTTTNASFTVGNASNSINIGQRQPVVDNPAGTASDPDLLYQFINKAAGPVRMYISFSYQAGGPLPFPTTTPVFNMSFADDSMCQRSIIYDSNNYTTNFVCAPGAWTSDTTIRGVTLRPMWTAGQMLIGVNPNPSGSKSQTGNVFYVSAPANGGDTINVVQWAKANSALLTWQVSTAE